jgi:hypothetical protein
MRNRIKVEYQSENGPIIIYYSVIGSSVEESIESITPHVNEYAIRTNTSINSIQGAN